MKVCAEVTMGDGTYDGWLAFLKAEEERKQFVTNENIEKLSENSRVSFEIMTWMV